jgi:hypothetical protein
MDFGDRAILYILAFAVGLGSAGFMYRPLDLPTDVQTDSRAVWFMHNAIAHRFDESNVLVFDSKEGFSVTPRYEMPVICWPGSEHCYHQEPAVVIQ